MVLFLSQGFLLLRLWFGHFKINFGVLASKRDAIASILVIIVQKWCGFDEGIIK